jgi:hypothetical protein
MRSVPLVNEYGTMWARNTENIHHIPTKKDGGVGIYILFDGSMPVYVGKGNIRWRITDARRSKRRGQLWDRFSWYALRDPKMMHDVEVLVLRMLPRYLRALTRQEGHFIDATRRTAQDKERVEYITRKPTKVASKKRKTKKRR